MKWYKTLLIYLAVLTSVFFGGYITALLTVEPKIEEVVKVEPYTLNGWELLTLAIMKTESDFNESAIGTKQDLGALQLTPIYVKEANRILGEDRYTHIDAFDIAKSIEMFNIVQDARNPEHDIEKAIYLHNPGGDAIGYASKVLENFRYISKIEDIRNIIAQ